MRAPLRALRVAFGDVPFESCAFFGAFWVPTGIAAVVENAPDLHDVILNAVVDRIGEPIGEEPMASVTNRVRVRAEGRG